MNPPSSPSFPLVGFFVVFSIVSTAKAESEKEESRRAPTSNSLLASVAYQAPTNFEKAFYGGGGVVYTRDYFVTSRTALGVQAALRAFPAQPLHAALGYGLTFKHYLGVGGDGPSSGVFLRYGLLLQMNFVEDREGTATGHDTNFALGFDTKSTGLSTTIELGYHLTQVRAFDQETLWWPYSELAAGIRF